MKRFFQSLDAAKAVDALGSLLALLVVGFAGWRLAGWIWLLLAPAPAPPAASMGGYSDVALVSSRPWFGDTVPAPEAEAALATTKAELSVAGIIAGGGRQAAIIGIGGGEPRAYLEGERLGPGMVLQAVARGYVTIMRDGIAERVELPRAAAAGPGPERETRKK